jgi:hypothetical protein
MEAVSVEADEAPEPVSCGLAVDAAVVVAGLGNGMVLAAGLAMVESPFLVNRGGAQMAARTRQEYRKREGWSLKFVAGSG